MNDMRSELILKLESMPKESSTLPIIQQSSALPTDHLDKFKEIYDRLAKLGTALTIHRKTAQASNHHHLK